MRVQVAKTKICHLTISADTENTNYGVAYGAYCICGDCMAWQYTEVQETKAMGTVHKKVVDIDHDTEDGYCKRIENGK